MDNPAFMQMMDDIFGTVPSRNIFRLEPKRIAALKSRIASWDGLVRVFIHPMYEMWRGNGGSFRIERGLSRLVRMPPAMVPPIIIFEEQEYATQLSLWLKYENQDTGLNCYTVETEPDDPTPFGYEKEYRAYGWGAVSDKFKKLGIRRILMGGVRLEIVGEPDWTGKSPFMCQCVGIALSHLSNRKAGAFEVELSALMDPPDARRHFAL